MGRSRTSPTRRARAAAAAMSAPAGDLPSPRQGRGHLPPAGDLRAQVDELAVHLMQVGADMELYARSLRRRQPEEAAAFSSAAAGAFALARRLHNLGHFAPTSHVGDAGTGLRAGGSRPGSPDSPPGSPMALWGAQHGPRER